MDHHVYRGGQGRDGLTGYPAAGRTVKRVPSSVVAGVLPARRRPIQAVTWLAVRTGLAALLSRSATHMAVWSAVSGMRSACARGESERFSIAERPSPSSSPALVAVSMSCDVSVTTSMPASPRKSVKREATGSG